jgi:hypothetical protein
MWGNPASFYQQEPYDHYAQWIEAQAINMQQYAFPYNDAGGYSSDIGCSNPKTLLVAIGWYQGLSPLIATLSLKPL